MSVGIAEKFICLVVRAAVTKQWDKVIYLRHQLHSRPQETPPELPSGFIFLFIPIRFHFLHNNREWFRILLRPLKRPVSEVDDTAPGCLIWFVVEFLSVDDRHDNFSVTRV